MGGLAVPFYQSRCKKVNQTGEAIFPAHSAIHRWQHG